jgi:diacylglycerol O-acyltransferase-1
MIILVLSNFRLILHTIRRHGFVFSNLPRWVDLRHSDDPWEEFPLIYGFLLLQLFIIAAFVIERLLCLGKFNELVGMTMHHLNAHLCLASSCFIVWNFIEKPAVGGALLFHGTMTWMKLLSYFLANEDYRLNSKSRKKHDAKRVLSIIENLDPQDEGIAYPRYERKNRVLLSI